MQVEAIVAKSVIPGEVVAATSAGEQESTPVEYANEILITKSELEEKNKLVHNLQQQVIGKTAIWRNNCFA